MKKVYLGITCFMVFILGINGAEAQYDNYYISNYNIDMIVHDDNSYDITETITTNLTNRHGIIRDIPLVNEVNREDGTSEKNRVQISDISVTSNGGYEQFVVNEDRHKVSIKIGDAGTLLNGTKEYNISYTYKLGKDSIKKYDELYFNLIGNQWDTSIKNVYFKITMPKEFDSSKLGFSAGDIGTVGMNNIYYNVEGNVITGKYIEGLTAYQGLTVRLELPEGYYVNAKANIDMHSIIVFLIPGIFVLIAFIFWLFFGKDGKKIETVEFTPPEGLNSAELGYIYKNKSSNADILSLIVYFANKGYLKIEQTSDNDFKLIKLKDYKGNNYVEKTFFNELFNLGMTVDKTDIEKHFYTPLNKIKIYLETKIEKEIYYKSSKNKKNIIAAMIVMIVALLVLELFGGISNITFEYAASSLVILILFFVVTSILMDSCTTKFHKILFTGISLCCFLPTIFATIPTIYFDNYFIILLIWCIICIGLLLLFINIMPKRTEKGLQLYGRIAGFKNFLDTVEKPQLEEQVQKNPNYFYDILPYTYVLGISNKWIKQFSDIQINPPNWYNGKDTFNFSSFDSFMNSTVHTSINIPRSSSSGGGDGSFGSSSGGSSGGGSSGGGGGSSGGGSGGGGGSSW